MEGQIWPTGLVFATCGVEGLSKKEKGLMDMDNTCDDYGVGRRV